MHKYVPYDEIPKSQYMLSICKSDNFKMKSYMGCATVNVSNTAFGSEEYHYLYIGS